ncbi:hypothetical protein Angca_001376, partial [Angiostrongylus cantonensis]
VFSATWTAAPTTRHSQGDVCMDVVASIEMFIFGLMLGFVLHAILFMERGSQL